MNYPAIKKCSQKCTHRLNLRKLNPVPASISDEELVDNICKAFSLTGHEVIPDDLEACGQP